LLKKRPGGAYTYQVVLDDYFPYCKKQLLGVIMSTTYRPFRPSHVAAFGFLFFALLSPVRMAQGQGADATLVGVGQGDIFHSRYYNTLVFGGIIQMNVDGEITDSYCIDMYLPIGIGDILLINGPLSDLRNDVDWCAINYILNNYDGTSVLEAGAIQCAIWYIASATYGPYTGSGGQYQFMTDPTDTLPYDGYSIYNGAQLRARTFEILAEVPVSPAGDCLARFPEVVDLTPDEVLVPNCSKQDVAMTATVYDQLGDPMPGQVVHIVTSDGQLSPLPAPADPCAPWTPGEVELTAVTDDEGQAHVLFSPCGPGDALSVQVWVEGEYGTLFFDEGNQLQPLTTLSLEAFSIADESLLECKDRKVPDGAVGCSHGFWKNHLGAWRTYFPEEYLVDVFGVPVSLGLPPGDTLLDGLNYGGGNNAQGAARNLLLPAVASLLNAVHADVLFPFTETEVLANVSDALASMDREAMIALAQVFDEANNLGCGDKKSSSKKD
jgi:hypothetical protein